MAVTPAPPAVIACRLRTQRLIGKPFASAVAAISWLGAVQSQDYAGAKWGLGQRTRGVTDADIDQLFDAGAILRTHVMRPTWHFVLPGDVRWLLALTAPRVKAILATYDRRLEVDKALVARSYAIFGKELRDGSYRTRSELGGALERSRIVAGGPRLGHLVMHAELDALVVSGPRRGKQFTYALMDERAPQSRGLDRDESLAELTRRYFNGHGPAQIQDFAWWSGLTAADAKRGLEIVGKDLHHELLDGRSHWTGLESQAPRLDSPTVHLLPNYDEFLVAYRDRSAYVDPSRTLDGAPFPYGSLLAHVVVVNGQVWGGWKRLNRGPDVVVQLGRLDALGPRATKRLHAAVDAFGRFLGSPVKLERGGDD